MKCGANKSLDVWNVESSVSNNCVTQCNGVNVAPVDMQIDCSIPEVVVVWQGCFYARFCLLREFHSLRLR
ncbi:hypothetical protein DMENIID0001_139200 [Sergentomyia squamirostris]